MLSAVWVIKAVTLVVYVAPRSIGFAK
jgi:hypothetical protein